MKAAIALLEETGSRLTPRLREQLEELGHRVLVGDLDAAHVGAPVTIRQARVDWAGIDIETAALVFTEQPVFPWPQPQGIFQQDLADRDLPRALAIEREARSLTVSALLTLAEQRAVLPDPEKAWLAVCPLAALDECQAAGLPIAEWRLAATADAAPLAMDVVGRDRWQRPVTPGAGQLRLEVTGPPEALAGPLREILVLDQSAPAARSSDDLAAWRQGLAQPIPLVPASPAADLATRAVQALGLSYGSVTLINPDDPAVLWVDLQPDLLNWDDLTDRQVLPAFARLLGSLADRPLSV